MRHDETGVILLLLKHPYVTWTISPTYWLSHMRDYRFLIALPTTIARGLYYQLPPQAGVLLLNVQHTIDRKERILKEMNRDNK